MTVLVDTGVLYADHDTDAARHDAASDALDAVYDGDFGQPYVSDYVYDEAVTLTLARSGSFGPAKRLGERLRGVDPYPEAYELRRVSSAVFDDAVEAFERDDDHGLSFTDATTVALCERHDIDTVLSFDDDFDGIVERVAPSSVGERSERTD
ncbi:type II toxin-antitoxin system VapC family toxin [Halobacterium sp. CBA1126]|uniref:type II toxin-antitoxin system VapC family toxin n=1 Tax=Halobacterium sp. CBA1126 TaxID=2668074 RepID=UPI0012FCD7B2|nr:type II toxin-antitoxin system VapC family toxin [Halobacterium sp. CBA1126]MUV59427.1 PIN domain-containing protein [Halobacterium sp. CBA1126]